MAWLVVLAPAELASTLSRLLSARASDLGVIAMTLIALRVMITTGGLMLGRRLATSRTSVRRLALIWAAGDLGTLAVVLASGLLPSNRAPGDAAIVWCAYAAATLVVIAAASSPPPPDNEA